MSDADLVLLDCTIRDGSYAIDFKFTAEDTALIAAQLDQAGVPYIEVGHGLGLGASEAGKGRAASHDIEVVSLTRERVERARIGAFFIPGIGREDDLREAAAAGLDFVRIGQDADRVETTWPFIELARELGLEPFLNFMKTYGVAPEAFARSARAGAEVGAAGVYVVDSAGGMMPHEVAEYVRATRAETDVPIGFHGHSNLHLAVANALAAYDAGATFIDTSVFGIGRSSGNVPTEVFAAVCDQLGIDCGVDALQVIDLAETYLRPLAEHLHPHDMVAVSLGLGRFHSSFLPRALDAAEQAGINPFRLIVALGREDVMRMTDASLARAVAELSDHPRPEVHREVASFSHPGFGPRRIGNRPQAIDELLDGLEVVAAKRRLDVVLDLVFAPALDEGAVTAEFVLEDDHMALGRVRFGSPAAAAEALSEHGTRVRLGLLDADALGSGELPGTARALAAALPGGIVPYRLGELELSRLADAALALVAAGGLDRVALCDPGTFRSSDVRALAAHLASAVRVDRLDGEVPAGVRGLVVVPGPVGSVRFADPDPDPDQTRLFARPGADADDRMSVVLDRTEAYRDTLPRWRAALAAARSAPRPELAL